MKAKRGPTSSGVKSIASSKGAKPKLPNTKEFDQMLANWPPKKAKKKKGGK